ncbi:MAG TPA: hypothetical protein VMW52_03485, partial [Phycisphaerae bacterium]|nr:hypothetical protein [Phycisphaerae bacterium]
MPSEQVVALMKGHPPLTPPLMPPDTADAYEVWRTTLWLLAEARHDAEQAARQLAEASGEVARCQGTANHAHQTLQDLTHR